MVGEEERVGDDTPRGVPRNVLFVDEDPHEFGNRESRMGLNDTLVQGAR